MKKTYTACFLLVLGSIFYYGSLIGGNNATCSRHGGYTALNSNPTTCSYSGCHTGIVNLDTTGMAQQDTNSTTTGIADMVFRQSLSAFPTVTSSFIQIVSTQASKGMEYSVYSLDGRMVLADVLPSYPALTYVDMHALAPAQYIVKVADADHSTTFRIVKN
jgi:hypothetical protein